MPETVEDEVARYTAALDRIEAKLDAVASELQAIRGETVVPVGDLAPNEPAATPSALGLLNYNTGAAPDGKPTPYSYLPGRLVIDLAPGHSITESKVRGYVPSDNDAAITQPADIGTDDLRTLTDVRLPAGEFWLPTSFALSDGGFWTEWETIPEWVRDRIREDLG